MASDILKDLNDEELQYLALIHNPFAGLPKEPEELLPGPKMTAEFIIIDFSKPTE